MNGTHHIHCHGLCSRCSRDAEVRHLDLAVCRNHDILRLDIPVYDLVIVGILDSLCNLNGNTDRFLKLDPAFFLNIGFEGDSLNIFHDDVIDPLIGTYIIDIHNIRMGQAGCCLCLCSEFCKKACIGSKFFLQHLHCNITVQLLVHCLVNIGHSACTDLIQDHITSCYHCTFIYHNQRFSCLSRSALCCKGVYQNHGNIIRSSILICCVNQLPDLFLFLCLTI